MGASAPVLCPGAQAFGRAFTTRIVFERVDNIIFKFSIGSCIVFNFKLFLDEMSILPFFEGAPILWVGQVSDGSLEAEKLTAVAANATIVTETDDAHSLSASV